MKRILISIFSLSVMACVPDPIDIKIEEAPTKLVISSQVIPNSIMIVTVSKSFGTLSQGENANPNQELIDQLLVDSAEVKISYNGIVENLYPIPDAPGVYFSINTPQILNSVYNLSVYDPKTKLSVTATAEMLEHVEIDTVWAKIDNSGSMKRTKVSCSFSDLPGIRNWYMLNIYTKSNDSLQNGSPFASNNIPTETILLDDQTFPSNQVTIDYTLIDWEQDTLIISLSNISRTYFDYLSARKKSGNLFTDVVKEPISYPTNIIGGYGFFNTHYPAISGTVAQP